MTSRGVGQPKSVSTQARAGAREAGGATMSAVILGSGAVCWLALRCQSVSASIRLPRSARERKMPCPSGHWLTSPSSAAPPSLRVTMSVPQRGQVRVSMQSTLPLSPGDPRVPAPVPGFRGSGRGGILHPCPCCGPVSPTSTRCCADPAGCSPSHPGEVLAFRALPSGRLADLLTRRRVAALQVPHRRGRWTVVTPGFVRRAHAAGKHVHVWTIDNPAEMRELLDRGVDGLMTDRTDILRDVLVERGQWEG